MAVKVAINGFGRIGRLLFRQIFGEKEFELVAINSSHAPKVLAHLLKYDSTQGRYKYASETSYTDDSIVVKGKKVKIIAERDVTKLPWKELGAELIFECTGSFNSLEKCSPHLTQGAKKVIISAPAGSDLKTIVYNVNHNILTKDDNIISAASCTTNCLAPMAKALNEAFPIVSGIMSTIHAYTSDQKVLDGPHKKGDLRRSRSAAINIVPNTTGAAKAIGLVIPELKGKLIGSAQRVPTPTGSTTLLYSVVKAKDLTIEMVNEAMKKAANESFGYTEDEIVSTDVIGMEFGSLFDATQTMVQKISDDLYQVQTVAWYDNENSYTAQMVRTGKYMANLM